MQICCFNGHAAWAGDGDRCSTFSTLGNNSRFMKIVFTLMFAMFSTFLLLLVLARPADHIERLEQQTDNATRNGPSEIEILPPCIAWTWHMPRPVSPSTLVGICTQCEGWEGKQRERRGKHIGRVRSLPYFDYICLAQVHGLVDCSWPVEWDSKLWGHRSAPVWNSRASVECGMYFQHFEHFVPW